MAIKLAHQQAKTPTDGKDVSTRDYADAAGGPADDLSTTGADVNVSGAAPPTTGQALIADDATNASWQTLPPSSDVAVEVTGADTTPGGLSSKIVAGANVSLAVLNPGANEQLEISATADTDVLVEVTGADTTPGGLSSKIAAGANVSIAVLNPGANEQLEISATADTDVLVEVTGADTTPGGLSAKVAAGTGIALATLNPGANEQLEISATGGGADKVFRWTADAGGDDFTITLPGVAMDNANYAVTATVVNTEFAGGIPFVKLPDLIGSDRTTTTFRMQTSTPLGFGDSIEFTVTARDTVDDQYDTFTVKFLTAPNIPAPITSRYGHTATKLADGRVLVCGGTNPAGSTRLSTSEVFDPATNTWTASGAMGEARANHAAVLMSDGRVLMMGGDTNAEVNGTDTCEVWDPTLGANGQWASADDFPTKIIGASLFSIASGPNTNDVLAACGNVPPSSTSNTSYIYDRVGDSWGSSAALPTGHRSHWDAQLSTGEIYVGGGFPGAGGSQTDVALWDETANTWSAVAPMPLAYGRTQKSVVMGNDKILLAGGETSPFVETDNTYVYDPVGDSWVTGPLLHSDLNFIWLATLPSGDVLVAGGGEGVSSGQTAIAQIFDQALNTLSAAPVNLPAPFLSGGATQHAARTAVQLDAPRGNLIVCGLTQPFAIAALCYEYQETDPN